MRTVVRRAVLGLTSLALVSGGTLATAPAQAANVPSGDAVGWLADQLQDGLITSDGWTQFGPTLDVLFAAEALGVRPEARTAILDAIEPRVDEYVGAGAESYAGPTGKLLAALQAEEIDAATYGTGDLLSRLQARVRTEDDAQQGRATDQSEWGDYSNTLGQSWVVRALADAGDPLAGSATEFLLQQQCQAGFFRESMGASVSVDAADFTCDTAADEDSRPSVDATALAVLALRSAQAAGVAGLGDDVKDAVAWLRKKQRGDGSFVGNGVPNSNSTGMAAWVLAGTRWKGSAGTAAAWLKRNQVTTRVAEGSALAGEQGAVAYDPAALRAGKQDGIADFMQWVLATAQSAVGLDALLPARKLTVEAPARAGRGDTVRVRATGLAAGERWTLRRGTKKVAAGWATANGVAVTKVTLVKAGKVVVSVTGSRASRDGSTAVRVR